MAADLKQTYETWKQCLFGENGHKFSKDFIASRLDVMNDKESIERIRFAEKYGEEYTIRIKEYFEKALQELS